MERYVDLHLHTCFSDGTSTPGELLDIVRRNNISAFSITDHDTLAGYRAVKELLSDYDPELITGLELSAMVENSDMHILAYCFDSDNEPLNQALNDFRYHRNQRGRLIVDKLNELGIDITFDDVETEADMAVIGRPHIAQAMYQKKATSYYEEAFHKYIGYDGPAYVPKKDFAPSDAVSLIHQAGGLAMLAHPAIDNKDQHIEMLTDVGLDGIEVYHPSHTQADIERFKQLAKRFRLLITGGSDFHGRVNRYGMVGSQKVPYVCFERIKDKATKN